MKKMLQSFILLFSIIGYSQNNNELKNEIEKIKNDITELKSEITSVKVQNLYFKKVLEINTPVIQQKEDGNEYRITRIMGNRSEKTISIHFFIEVKDENKTSSLEDFSLVDLLGNEYQIDFNNSSYPYLKLSVDVPLNIKITFKDIIEEPKLIKLFRFNSRNEPERNPFDSTKSRLEFRDLNVIWE
ncbi:transposase [Empedobacter brevis]|uniref:transposase n=1 Tax=Empedobacter brevis TaxID=247 RepID=UPI00123C9914|nr:transposase [Empedobacter brevis]QES92819.1 transposase [Empedobacter brevis]